MENTTSQDLAFRKNEFYRNAYRRTMKWLVFSSFIAAILALVLAWMTYFQKQPAYYAAVTTGEVVPMHSLSEPIMTRTFVQEWSARAARQIFNLNFSTFQQQLKSIQDHFSSNGWTQMMNAMQQSGLLKTLVLEKVIMSAVVSNQPYIVSQLIIHERYTWRVQVPMLIKFTSASSETQLNFLITMNVQRVPTLEAAHGIQIVDFTAQQIQ